MGLLFPERGESKLLMACIASGREGGRGGTEAGEHSYGEGL